LNLGQIPMAATSSESNGSLSPPSAPAARLALLSLGPPLMMV